ncbi:MAG: 3'-5' exonuclease [Bacteroidetes bacterium]|nr:3'-5' exonuclease [Bacteroidota bacterium]MBU1717694.1 3'-5' exonuclease [Bacteroidota bacterium]
MNLLLYRPMAFFDIESTGIDVIKDRIVEISVLKLQPDGSRLVYTARVNPGIPISPRATEIHGISDADVADCPSFKEISGDLNVFLKQCDLSGYNAQKFDIPMLDEEFTRAGIDFEVEKRRIVDVMNIFHKMEQRTLAAAYKFYCDKELVNAHSAQADVTATYEILLAQLDRYDNLKSDVESLSEFSAHTRNADLVGRIVFDDNDVEVFNFGKHKGKKVVDVFKVEPSYYDWMIRGDFPGSTKKVITQIRLKEFGK